MDLKPVWWLDDYWGWDLLTKNLANVTNQMYTGRGDFQTFLTKSIENCLEIRGKDPETHVHDKSDKEKLKRKKINKGIHEATHIVENDNNPEPADIHETSFQDLDLGLGLDLDLELNLDLNLEQETLETITSEYRFPIVESNQTNLCTKKTNAR